MDAEDDHARILRVFGRLEPNQLPSSSSLDLKHLQANNPLTLVKKEGMNRLPYWLYFDYGSKEGFEGVTEGKQRFWRRCWEKEAIQIPLQSFNGKSGHNYHFGAAGQEYPSTSFRCLSKKCS